MKQTGSSTGFLNNKLVNREFVNNTRNRSGSGLKGPGLEEKKASHGAQNLQVQLSTNLIFIACLFYKCHLMTNVHYMLPEHKVV